MNIVSLAPSITEIIYEIGKEDNLVANTSLCDFPEEAIYKPSVGGWTSVDKSKVEEFDPDLILASDDLQNQIVKELRQEGMEIEQFNPHTLEEVFESILQVGKLLDVDERADEIVNQMKGDLEEIEINSETRIYCEEWSDPPMISGNWVPDLIRSINGIYPIDSGKRSRKIQKGEVSSFNPEFIFLNICGAAKKVEREKLTNREGWSVIDAIKNDRVHVVDDSLLNRSGPRLVKGAKEIAKTVNNNI